MPCSSHEAPEGTRGSHTLPTRVCIRVHRLAHAHMLTRTRAHAHTHLLTLTTHHTHANSHPATSTLAHVIHMHILTSPINTLCCCTRTYTHTHIHRLWHARTLTHSPVHAPHIPSCSHTHTQAHTRARPHSLPPRSLSAPSLPHWNVFPEAPGETRLPDSAGLWGPHASPAAQ